MSLEESKVTDETHLTPFDFIFFDLSDVAIIDVKGALGTP